MFIKIILIDNELKFYYIVYIFLDVVEEKIFLVGKNINEFWEFYFGLLYLIEDYKVYFFIYVMIFFWLYGKFFFLFYSIGNLFVLCIDN